MTYMYSQRYIQCTYAVKFIQIQLSSPVRLKRRHGYTCTKGLVKSMLPKIGESFVIGAGVREVIWTVAESFPPQNEFNGESLYLGSHFIPSNTDTGNSTQLTKATELAHWWDPLHLPPDQVSSPKPSTCMHHTKLGGVEGVGVSEFVKCCLQYAARDT